jgi:hypothetical protein
VKVLQNTHSVKTTWACEGRTLEEIIMIVTWIGTTLLCSRGQKEQCEIDLKTMCVVWCTWRWNSETNSKTLSIALPTLFTFLLNIDSIKNIKNTTLYRVTSCDLKYYALSICIKCFHNFCDVAKLVIIHKKI